MLSFPSRDLTDVKLSSLCYTVNTWALAYSGAGRANRKLLAHISEAVGRDPGRRMLVTVRVERWYAVVDGLRQIDEVALMPL